MKDTRRRYPRVTVTQPAEMEVRFNAPNGNVTRRTRMPVTITSISCEGIGLEVRKPQGYDLETGIIVTTCFTAGDMHVELPGRVVWFHPSRTQPQELQMGIQLRLELAIAIMRQKFATWVVALTNKLPR